MQDRTASTNWKEATATVISSDYRYALLRDLDLDSYMDRSFFVICFSYMVNGETFYGDLEQHGPMDVGDHFNVLYDPKDPSKNSFSKVEKTVLSRMIFGRLV